MSSTVPLSGDCNYLKFLDRQVWANSVDPDQIAPLAVWSGSTLFAKHRLGTVMYDKITLFKFKDNYSYFF